MSANRKEGTQDAEAVPHRLLAPVDFSEPSRKGLAAAVALAQHFGAELTVLHVTRRNRPDTHPPMELLGLGRDTRHAGQKKLEEFVTREMPDSLKTSIVVREGVPFEEIAKTAQSENIDWIIIATHGHTGFKHLLVGSTTERVIRHAPCPVLVVRSNKQLEEGNWINLASLRTILVPTDLSKNSTAAFVPALALARQSGAHIILIYVAPGHLAKEHPNLGHIVVHPWPAPDSKQDATLLRERVTQMAEKRLSALGREYFPDASVETDVLEGKVAQTICAAAASRGAGLIVIASRGHTHREQDELGSIAERVVQRATCPVFVVCASEIGSPSSHRATRSYVSRC